MARKDVNLVIRARDEATRALGKINASLEEFRVNQEDVAGTAGKVGSSLSGLASTFDKVERALGGLSSADQYAQSLSRAEQALRDLSAESAKVSSDLSNTRAEYRRVERSLKGYQQTLQNTEGRLESIRQKQKQAVQAQRDQSKAAERAAASQQKLVDAKSKLPGLIEQESAKLVKARDRYNELAAAMSKTEAPSKRMQQNFESSGNNVTRLEGKLTGLIEKFARIDAEIKDSDKAFKSFSNGAARAEREVSKQDSALAKTAARYDELRKKIKLTETELNGLGRARSSGEQGLGRVEKDLDNAKVAMEGLQQASKETEAVLASLRQQTVSRLEQDLVEQGVAAQRAKAEFLELREESQRLKTAIGAVGVPTQKMAQGLQFASQASEEAEFKFLQQQETLERMGRAFRAGGTDIESLRTKLNTFGSEQNRNAAALQQLSEGGLRARNELRKFNNEVSRSNVKRLSSDFRATGRAADQAGKKISSLRQVYRDIYGETRQSLSINQRLRGQVLSLVAAYGGFYGVINILGQVVRAYGEIEGAQARLMVANNDNIRQTAEDMDFLRRTSDRLGVDLGTLSREYSKFLIATKNTNLEGERARNIFLQISEAARVNRASTDDLKGTFVALTQIVNKGSVQMEELRQQLAERLPGALQLMADGLGITTDELVKMMEQGKVTADALVNLGDEVENRFGGQLETSLSSITVEMGRLQNAVFQALLQFGEQGFLDEFIELIRDLTSLLKTAEFAAFSQGVSTMTATVVSAIRLVINNLNTFATILGAAFGLKLTRTFNILFGAINDVGNALARKQRRVQAFSRATRNMGTSATIAAGAFTTLRGAISGLLTSTGLGLFLALGGAIFANWATSASDANEALEEHQRILDLVKNAYDDAKGRVEEWREEIKGLSEEQIQTNLLELESAELGELEKVRDALDEILTFQGAAFEGNPLRPLAQDVESLLGQLENGEIKAKEFAESLSEVFQDTGIEDNTVLGIISSAQDAAGGLAKFQDAIEKTENVLKAMTGTGEDSQEALDEVGESAAESSGDLRPLIRNAEDADEALQKMADSSETLQDSIRGMLRTLPGFEDVLDDIEEQEAFQKLKEDAIDAALEILNLEEVTGDFKAAWDRAMEALGGSGSAIAAGLLGDLDEMRTIGRDLVSVFSELKGIFSALGGLAGQVSGAFGGLGGLIEGAFGQITGNPFGDATGSVASSAALLRDKEDFRGDAYWDVNAWRTGYGSDTYMVGNQVLPVTEQTVVTLEQAEADLARRIGEFQDTIRGQIGSDRFEQFGDRQQAALTSIAYNYGSLPGRLTAVIDGGSVEEIAAAIQALGGDGPFREDGTPVNQGRRQQEAAIFLAGGNADPEVIQDQVATQRELNAETQESISDRQFEVEQQQLLNQGLEREAAIREAVREARRDNPGISEEDLQGVRDVTNALFDQEQEAQRLSDARSAAEDARQARIGTQDTLSDADFAIRQQQLINEGKERQAEIEEAIRSAKASDPNITEEEIRLLSERTARLYDLKEAQDSATTAAERAELAQQRVNQLISERGNLERQLDIYKEQNDQAGIENTTADIAELNNEILSAIDNAQGMWEAIGGDEARAALSTLQTARLETEAYAAANRQVALDLTSVAETFTSGLTNAMSEYIRLMAEGATSAEAAKQAFLQFAADFLLQIGQMILKQLLFNAISSILPGGMGKALGFARVGTAHTGGIVGSSRVGSGNASRLVNPMVFASARRFHGGGMVGLGPKEVPIIAKENERVLTEAQNKQWENAGKGGSSGRTAVKIINALSSSDIVSEGVATRAGEQAILNFISQNRDVIRSELDG